MPNRSAEWRDDDPAYWPEYCELGCEHYFHTMDATATPLGRHQRLGIPSCGMARALARAYYRKLDRKNNPNRRPHNYIPTEWNELVVYDENEWWEKVELESDAKPESISRSRSRSRSRAEARSRSRNLK